MKLYGGKIAPLSEELLRSLADDGDIEVESPEEVRLDFESVFKAFLRLDREVQDEARRRIEQRAGAESHLGRARAQVAKERGAPPPDEILPYLVNQILEMLFHSAHVAEVFADDATLRKKITSLLKKHMEVEDELDREVRAKIRNLEEGTAAFDVEYSKVMDQIKRNRGLSS